MDKMLDIDNRLKVSIIVPIYNVEKYLEECLKSILLQSFKNYELILINDGSTDLSKSIVEKFWKDSRVIYVEQENKGLSEARNRGIEEAKGDYITFIDSDDWISNEYLENMISCAINEDADIVSMSYCQIKGKEKKERRRYYKVFETNCADSLFGFYDNNYAWGKLIRTSIVKNNHIRFPAKMRYEDVGTMYKIYDHCQKIVVSDKGKYYYRVRENSITSKRTINDVMDKISFLKEMNSYCLNDKYRFWELYISVKAFGSMADLYKVSNLNINTRNQLQKEIYRLTPSVKLLVIRSVPVNIYIRSVFMQMKIAHVLLKIKYRK